MGLAYQQNQNLWAELDAMFIWLNRAGYNGLYRTNKAGKLNAPIGSGIKPPQDRAHNLEELEAVAEALQGVHLISDPDEIYALWL